VGVGVEAVDLPLWVYIGRYTCICIYTHIGRHTSSVCVGVSVLECVWV